MMDTTTGVFARVGTAITHDTGDYERLDRHYQVGALDRDGHWGCRGCLRSSFSPGGTAKNGF